MKFLKISLLVCLSLLALNSVSASSNPTKKESKKEVNDAPEKNGDWYLYIEDAKKESDKTGKPILANFTGSDWCGWCIRLKKEVFNTEEFKEWADENVVLLELDFPGKKQLPENLKAQNRYLQQVFRVSGYPTIWLFNLDFNKESKQYQISAIGKTGYVAGGPKEWIKQTETILDRK